MVAKRKVLDDAIRREMQLWKEAHPVTSKSSKFESRKQAAVRESLEMGEGLYGGLLHELKEMNLSEAALLISLQDEFSESEAQSKLKQDLQKAQKPETVEILIMKLPKNWTVRRIPEKRMGEAYELEFMRKVSILSSSPLWRLQAFGVRYFTSIWNSSFFLINKATVALRRWNLLRDSFDCIVPAVNPNTGQFLTAPIRTLRGRISALCDWRKEVLRRARLGEHIIRIREGLYLDTCWAHFWTTMGVGLGSSSVTIYTLAESIVVVVGSGVALVTSPVWSLITNLGFALHNALIYDSDLPHEAEKRKSPLLRNLFGISTILFSTLRAFFHSLKGAAFAIGGEFCYLWDRTWHAIMTLMLRRAEVPTSAEGFFWSTSGPGMKTPYVLIDSDTAILALMAHLSKQELSAARLEMKAELNEPREVLCERVRSDSAGAMTLPEIQIVSDSISRSELENQMDLDRFHQLAATEREYSELLRGVHDPRIRMKQQEFDSFYSKAIPLIKKFHIERYFPRLLFQDIVEFWEWRNLVPGDWKGLTDHVISAIFSNEIVVPFEAAADDLVVEANQISGLETIVHEALKEQGIVTGTCTEYRVGHPINHELIPQEPNYESLPIQFMPQPTQRTKEA